MCCSLSRSFSTSCGIAHHQLWCYDTTLEMSLHIHSRKELSTQHTPATLKSRVRAQGQRRDSYFSVEWQRDKKLLETVIWKGTAQHYQQKKTQQQDGTEMMAVSLSHAHDRAAGPKCTLKIHSHKMTALVLLRLHLRRIPAPRGGLVLSVFREGGVRTLHV